MPVTLFSLLSLNQSWEVKQEKEKQNFDSKSKNNNDNKNVHIPATFYEILKFQKRPMRVSTKYLATKSIEALEKYLFIF